MNKYNKTEQIYEIVQGKNQLSSPIIESNILDKIDGYNWPKLKARRFILYTLMLIGILFSIGFYVEALDPIRTHLLIGVCVALIGIVFTTIRILIYQINLARKLDTLFQEGLGELVEFLVYLKTYQKNLDKRTSRYFHCVTNSKVTSYAILTQMTAALSDRISIIEYFLSAPSFNNLAQAHQEFKKAIVFNDGLVLDRGNLHSVPLTKLQMVITQLTEYLDQDLNNLEEEIGFDYHEESDSLDSEPAN